MKVDVKHFEPAFQSSMSESKNWGEDLRLSSNQPGNQPETLTILYAGRVYMFSGLSDHTVNEILRFMENQMPKKELLLRTKRSDVQASRTACLLRFLESRRERVAPQLTTNDSQAHHRHSFNSH